MIWPNASFIKLDSKIERRPSVRWPLKNQILVRMLFLLLMTIAAITFANIRAVITDTRNRQSEQNRKIVKLLSSTRFPLTTSVLESMKSLSGAEFVVVGQSGEIVGRTSAAPSDTKLLKLLGNSVSPNDATEPFKASKIMVAGVGYYHSVVFNRQEQSRLTNSKFVHIFFPRQTESSLWWVASKSPLLIAALVLPIACLIGLAFASQVTRPLGKLKHQVQRIAEGEIFELPQTNHNDEIRDLNQAVNEMANKLQDHDEQLRQNERLQTMIQFGSGIAHHLRNSATGCQLAIELLTTDHPGISETENYQVAIRQIGLMNNHIKKFLLFAKSPGGGRVDESHDVHLDKILERLVFLLRPSVKHLGVDLTVTNNCDRPNFRMTEEDAEQLVMNLITNAITAVSSVEGQANPVCRNDEDRGSQIDETTRQTPRVAVELFRNSEDILTLRVIDNGPGPPVEIAQDLFQPFVTGSREGTGLGLSLVREIAERVNGTIEWQRAGHETVFTFKFGRAAVSDGGEL